MACGRGCAPYSTQKGRVCVRRTQNPNVIGSLGKAATRLGHLSSSTIQEVWIETGSARPSSCSRNFGSSGWYRENGCFEWVQRQDAQKCSRAQFYCTSSERAAQHAEKTMTKSCVTVKDTRQRDTQDSAFRFVIHGLYEAGVRATRPSTFVPLTVYTKSDVEGWLPDARPRTPLLGRATRAAPPS